jgi:hypothetical protein
VGVLLLFTEEFELVIMIEWRPKRCMGRTEFPDLRGLRCEPWLDRPFFIESEMALLFRVHAVVCSKSA